MGNTQSSNSGNKSSSDLLSSKNLKVGSTYKGINTFILRDKGCYRVTTKKKVVMPNNRPPRYSLSFKGSSGRKSYFTAFNADKKFFKKCKARTLKKKAK